MCLQQEEVDLLSSILMATPYRALPALRAKEKKRVLPGGALANSKGGEIVMLL
jgi:hypothetical protein